MTQVIEGSTAPTFAGEARLIDPADFGPWCLQDIDSEGGFLPSPTRVMFLTSASDLGTGGWISPNATGVWKVSQIPLPHDRVSSLVDDAKLQPFIRFEPYGIGGGRQAVRTIGEAPSILEYGRAIPEASAHTWNSNLQVLLLEEQLVSYFTNLVREATDEVFLDGMESAFSRGLTSAIKEYGDASVYTIQRLLTAGKADAEAAGEILRQLGSMENPPTHRSRLKILTDQLHSPDPRIRDGASLGLAAMDDPVAIGAIQKALERESSPRLLENLRLVLDQLQSTKWQGS